MTVRDEVMMLIERLAQALGPSLGLGPGVLDTQIDALGERLDLPIPPDLRTWLRACNPLPRNRFGLLGIPNDEREYGIERHFDRRSAWKARRWIPIASDDFGNPYVLVTTASTSAGTPVLFIDHERGSNTPGYIVASGVWSFVRCVLEEEEHNLRTVAELGEAADDDETVDWYWPFDEEQVLAQDPALARYTGIRKAWEPDTNFHGLVLAVQSRGDLIRLACTLGDEIDRYPDEWRITTMRDFLALVARYLQDEERLARKRGTPPEEQPTWRTLADLLVSARSYALEGFWDEE